MLAVSNTAPENLEGKETRRFSCRIKSGAIRCCQLSHERCLPWLHFFFFLGGPPQQAWSCEVIGWWGIPERFCDRGGHAWRGDGADNDSLCVCVSGPGVGGLILLGPLPGPGPGPGSRKGDDGESGWHDGILVHFQDWGEGWLRGRGDGMGWAMFAV